MPTIDLAQCAICQRPKRLPGDYCGQCKKLKVAKPPPAPRRCECCGELNVVPPERELCRDCLAFTEDLGTFTANYVSPSLRDPAVHEAAIQRYTVRAAARLPLFEEGDRDSA